MTQTSLCEGLPLSSSAPSPPLLHLVLLVSGPLGAGFDCDSALPKVHHFNAVRAVTHASKQNFK